MAYYIWRAFEQARREDLPAENAFEAFSTYFRQSTGEFTEEIQ